jgi:glycosyltransferase involved in cell wall biosynthesis
LFLGRMTPDKGVLWAISAARKTGTPLLVAGKMRSPEEVAFFDEEVAPLLSDEVRYLGEIPHDEKVELLGRARALLFPTLWNEPFGMVTLEAFACGTPVISTLHGAVPEVVEDGVTGFLCQDEPAFAEAISRIDAIDRRACRAAVEGYFSADRMVTNYLSLFDLLVR